MQDIHTKIMYSILESTLLKCVCYLIKIITERDSYIKEETLFIKVLLHNLNLQDICLF